MTVRSNLHLPDFNMLIFMPLVNPGYRPIPTVRKSVVNDMIHFSAGNYVAAIFTAMPAAMLPLLRGPGEFLY